MVNWLTALLMLGFVGGPSERMIVEFTKDECAPCQQLRPAVERLKQQGWVVRTVNTDREPLVVRRFAVQSVPTLIVMDGGREVDRIVGAAPYEKLAVRLELLDQHRESTADVAAPKLLSSTPSAGTATTAMPEPLPLLSATPVPAQAPKNNLQTAQVSQPNMTVRGQSPALGAFPMLNAVADSARAAAAPVEQAMRREGQQLINGLAATAPSVITEAARNAAAQVIPASATSPLTSAKSPLLNTQQAIQRAEAATVRIRVDEDRSTAYGTGTIIDVHGDEALVLTCGHIFREMKPDSQLTVDLYNGHSQPTNLPAQLIDFQAQEGQPDIGVLSIKLPFTVAPVPLLPKGQTLSNGQRAFSFGCDHGENPTRRDTQIKHINRYLGPENVEIAGAPTVGRSGGGLFDAQGRLVGVCNAADAEGDEGIYAAGKAIQLQLERLQLTHLIEDQAAPTGLNAHLASNRADHPHPQSPVVSTRNPNQPTATDNSTIQWPDERAGAGLLAAQPNRSSGAGSAQRVTCVIRDAQGKDNVVTIESPSPELLQAIQRHAVNR